MKDNILKLNNEFNKIKNLGLVKSMRKGPTGIGYTFETLIGKKEDQNSLPDYEGIEIKCKLGYSKTDTTLFTCAPKRDNEQATTYLFEKYSYHLYGNTSNYKLFSRKIFYNSTFELYNFTFKIYVDYSKKKIFIKSFKNKKFYENVCYWNFEDLFKKINLKINTLALVKGYPYRRNNEIYYKYFTINFYKLKNFETFLKMIEHGYIYVIIYLKEVLNNQENKTIENHGFTFKIKNNYIEKLFYKIKP